MYKTSADCIQLYAEGGLVLADVSRAGMRIDKGYLDSTIAFAEQKVQKYEKEIRSMPAYKIWQRRFGEKTNIGSSEQLSKVIFTDFGYKYKPTLMTDSGERESASEKALEHVDHPLVHAYKRAGKFRRLCGTYLGGIRREIVERDGMWFVHPSFNLNTVVHGRSSGSKPNVQNQLKRDPEFMELLRKCFIVRPGMQNIEDDLSSAEVKVCANYTLDPVAVSECNDPKRDPHRDTASRLLFLEEHEVSKEVRSSIKNKFVFAQFYGDWYVTCAMNIWHDMQDTENMKVKGSTETILDRLKKNGITQRGVCTGKERPLAGTFEAHVQSVEDWYWNTKYKVHTQWKRDWWEAYQRTGGMLTKTGFAMNGIYDRKKCVNYPISGDSFRQLLWLMIWRAKKIKKYKMNAMMIDEIHDSINSEVHPNDRDNYIELCFEGIRELVKAWPWLEVVPPQTEIEACPIDGNWACKAELTRREGVWSPKNLEDWEKKYGRWV